MIADVTKKTTDMKKLSMAILGTALFALGMNLFIVPIGLYSGGIMGICQVMRTLLIDYLHLPLGNFDITGVLYYLANIPIFILAYKSMGKTFCFKTFICITTTSLFLSVVKISNPILADDILASCVIGGIISGVGVGLTLKMGASSGGTDIIGLYFIKKKGDFSIGKINLIVNLALYLVCFLLFDERTVIYSIIYAAVVSFTIDKIHSQNINVQALIITKKADQELEKELMNKLLRGVTKWSAKGVYTGKESTVLFIVLSKYEVTRLKQIVHKHDPEAFVVLNEDISIDGNYLKKV